MATRTGRLFHDQNLIGNVNGTVSGKVDFTGQGKARVGGRKPLGDLSNAINQVDGKKALKSLNTAKPSVNQSSKPQKSKNPAIIINDEAVSAKAKNLESNKRTASKATEKSRTGSRKVLSDISNLGKPQVPEIKNKNSLKPSSLTGKSLHPPSAIAEEQILHNHQECIKSQLETVDMHQFLKTVGLEDDSDDHMKVSFELPASRKLKSESAYLEMAEVPEQLPEVQSLSAEHGSPAHCKTPKLPSCCTLWNDFAVNFKLIETPKLSKN